MSEAKPQRGAGAEPMEVTPRPKKWGFGADTPKMNSVIYVTAIVASNFAYVFSTPCTFGRQAPRQMDEGRHPPPRNPPLPAAVPVVWVMSKPLRWTDASV